MCIRDSGEIERVEVFVGDLSSEATASGELTARQRAALAPLTTGTVDEVLAVSYTHLDVYKRQRR